MKTQNSIYNSIVKVLFLFIVFLSLNVFSLIVSQPAVEKALQTADFIVEGEVINYSTEHNSKFFSQYKAQVSVTDTIQSKASTTLPKEITVIGYGGDYKERGVSYSGFAKPRKNKSYKMYLKARGDGNFEIVGFDRGLVSLEQERGFSRNRTDGSNGDGTGPYLFWREKYFPIPYYLSYPSLKNFPSFIAAIDASFQTWQAVADIGVEFLPMGCTSSTENINDGMNQIIYISKNWGFDSSVIALTRNFYLAGDIPEAGMILDSDILLNGVNFSFTTTGETGKYDVQDILTHEIGHLLGLGHELSPGNTDATMYAVAAPNETKKRVLHDSDLAGIRSAYSGTTNKTSRTLASPCQFPDGIAKSCASVSSSKGNWLHLVILFLGITLIWSLAHLKLIRRQT